MKTCAVVSLIGVRVLTLMLFILKTCPWCLQTTLAVSRSEFVIECRTATLYGTSETGLYGEESLDGPVSEGDAKEPTSEDAPNVGGRQTGGGESREAEQVYELGRNTKETAKSLLLFLLRLVTG